MAGCGAGSFLKLLSCITDHGFGHATRQMAVAERLRELEPRAHVTFFTSAPRSLFEGYLGAGEWYDVQDVRMDVGVRQPHSLEEDLDATHRALEALWDEGDLVGDVAARRRAGGFDHVIADIPPAAMLAAGRARVALTVTGNFD